MILKTLTCLYIDVRLESSIGTDHLNLARADEAAGDEEQKPRLGWLLETRKPKELHMYEVPYRGPPILWKRRPAFDSWRRQQQQHKGQ